MTDAESRATTLVVDGHVLEVRVDCSGVPRSMVVSVELDYGRSWLFDEPGWQDLAFGASGELVYWWSARHLVVLPSDVRSEPAVISADEDIRLVFAVTGGWLLVCETSVRLFAEGHEVSRIEFGEPLLLARWDAPRLVVGDAAGHDTSVVVAEGRLVA